MPPDRNNMEAEWESHKTTILDLYFAEGMTLDKVMVHMKQNCGFDQSKARYESRFRKWNLRKNLNSSEWRYFSRRVQKRLRRGKESAVYFNRVAIAPEKVRKETSRHDLPTYDTVPTPKTPNDLCVCTPASATMTPSTTDSSAILENRPSTSFSAHKVYEIPFSVQNYLKTPATSSFDPWAMAESLEEGVLRFLKAKDEGGDLPNCLQSSIGVQAAAILQDTLLQLEGGNRLVFAAHRDEVDVVIIVADETRSLAMTNMSEAILPQIQLILAAYYGNAQSFSTFLGSKDGQRLISTSLGKYVVRIAAERSHFSIITELVTAGVKIDVRGTRGNTALHYATLREDVAMVVFLLDHGHGVDIKNDFGETPWSANIFNRNEKILNILLAYGADPNTAGRARISELCSAAMHGDTEHARFLLKSGTDLSITTNFGGAPLHFAACHGHLDCVRLLIDAGADVSPVSNEGETPLDLALRHNQTLIVKRLGGVGAKTSTQLFAEIVSETLAAAGL